MGACVVYADDFAKELMQCDEELKHKISAVFGSDAYQADGSLNRKYLAAEAFGKGRVEELNKLVHPLLWNRLDELAVKKKKEGCLVFVVEAAILLNNGRPSHMDYVILLQAEQQGRIERVIKRDNAEEHEILNRISKQPDFRTLSAFSDYEVVNDGTVEDLKNKARIIYEDLKLKAQS